MVRLGMKTFWLKKLTTLVNRMPISSTRPITLVVGPAISTMSFTSMASQKISVSPITMSWTSPWEPKLIARPSTEALAR